MIELKFRKILEELTDIKVSHGQGFFLASILFSVIGSFNRIVGKSMLENKSPQIVRKCMSSYGGYQRDKRFISCVIVECDSNENQASESS